HQRVEFGSAMLRLAPQIAALSFASCLVAQSTLPSPGLTLADPLGQPSALLVDANSQTVHNWTFQAAPGIASYLDRDGNILRAYRNGSTGIGAGGGLERVAFDGTVLW